MKSKANPTRKKKQVSIQMWVSLIVGFGGIMSCIWFGFYLLITSSADNLQTSTAISTNTELPLVVPSTATYLPQPTLAPTWTPIPTSTPFVLTELQIINPSSNSVCAWMDHIEGEWVSDLWGQIVTFYTNGVYVQLDKKLVDYGESMSVRGTYECTSEGYIRMLLDGEEIFETSIVRVNIAGNKMKWTLVDDNPINGYGHDITFSFVKK